jgi:hypothetical protein
MGGLARSTVVSVLLLLLLVAGATGAWREDDTRVIEAGDHVDILVENPGSGDMDVRYYVVVSEGPAIDVFWLDEDNHAKYVGEEAFEHYQDYSTIETTNVDKSFVWDENGRFYLVLDNTLSGTEPPDDEAATVRYVVNWSPVEESDWLRSTGFLFIAVFLMIFAAILIVTLLRRKG